MKKLFDQIMKFAGVGVVCFIIDWLIGLVIMNIAKAFLGADSLELASMIGSAVGFSVSVIVNYILSFKFVFQRKEEMNRGKEFVVFIILSVIGLGINQLIIYIVIGPFYGNALWLQELINDSLAYTGAKVIATAIVMVYNFVTRKIFLEKKD